MGSSETIPMGDVSGRLRTDEIVRGMAAGALAAGALAAGTWAVRGRSSAVFGPSVWHGDRSRPEIAITFDDGPAIGTPAVLRLLEKYKVPATFFQCGENVRALPEIALEVVSKGHELGNHSFSHPLFPLRAPSFIAQEFQRAQDEIIQTTGTTPRYLRVPFGARWFGFDRVPMTGVMWDVIGLDWKLSAADIARRILSRTRNGSILCLHDGRGLDRSASNQNTLEALRWILPQLLDRGYRFQTISELLCQM